MCLGSLSQNNKQTKTALGGSGYALQLAVDRLVADAPERVLLGVGDVVARDVQLGQCPIVLEGFSFDECCKNYGPRDT